MSKQTPQKKGKKKRRHSGYADGIVKLIPAWFKSQKDILVIRKAVEKPIELNDTDDNDVFLLKGGSEYVHRQAIGSAGLHDYADVEEKTGHEYSEVEENLNPRNEYSKVNRLARSKVKEATVSNNSGGDVAADIYAHLGDEQPHPQKKQQGYEICDITKHMPSNSLAYVFQYSQLQGQGSSSTAAELDDYAKLQNGNNDLPEIMEQGSDSEYESDGGFEKESNSKKLKYEVMNPDEYEEWFHQRAKMLEKQGMNMGSDRCYDDFEPIKPDDYEVWFIKRAAHLARKGLNNGRNSCYDTFEDARKMDPASHWEHSVDTSYDNNKESSATNTDPTQFHHYGKREEEAAFLPESPQEPRYGLLGNVAMEIDPEAESDAFARSLSKIHRVFSRSGQSINPVDDAGGDVNESKRLSKIHRVFSRTAYYSQHNKHEKKSVSKKNFGDPTLFQATNSKRTIRPLSVSRENPLFGANEEEEDDAQVHSEKPRPMSLTGDDILKKEERSPERKSSTESSGSFLFEGPELRKVIRDVVSDQRKKSPNEKLYQPKSNSLLLNTNMDEIPKKENRMQLAGPTKKLDKMFSDSKDISKKKVDDTLLVAPPMEDIRHSKPSDTGSAEDYITFESDEEEEEIRGFLI